MVERFYRLEPIVSNSVGPFLSVRIRWLKVIQSFHDWFKKTTEGKIELLKWFVEAPNVRMYQEGYFTCYFWCGPASIPLWFFRVMKKPMILNEDFSSFRSFVITMQWNVGTGADHNLRRRCEYSLGRCSHLSWVIFFINILKRIFSLGMTSFMDWNQCILHFFDGVMFSNIENPGILIPLKIKARTSKIWLKKKNIQRTRGYDLLYLQNLSFVDIVNQITWVIHLGEETCNMLTAFSKNKNDIIMTTFLHIYHNLD